MILQSTENISSVDQILQWKKHGKMLKMFLVKHFIAKQTKCTTSIGCALRLATLSFQGMNMQA